jgi:hypothetical protein
MKELLASIGALVRSFALIVGISHAIGYLAFARYYSLWTLIPGIALIVTSMVPFPWKGSGPYIVIVTSGFAAWSYMEIGVPFLDVSFSPVARFIFLAEFLIIAFALVSAMIVVIRAGLPPRLSG